MIWDYFWLYMCHVCLWYFLNIAYKLAYHIKQGTPVNGAGWFWGVAIGAFSLFFHYSLHKVGYAPLIIK